MRASRWPSRASATRTRSSSGRAGPQHGHHFSSAAFPSFSSACSGGRSTTSASSATWADRTASHSASRSPSSRSISFRSGEASSTCSASRSSSATRTTPCTPKRLMLRSGAWGTDFRTIDFDQIANLEVSVNPVENASQVGSIRFYAKMPGVKRQPRRARDFRRHQGSVRGLQAHQEDPRRATAACGCLTSHRADLRGR